MAICPRCHEGYLIANSEREKMACPTCGYSYDYAKKVVPYSELLSLYNKALERIKELEARLGGSESQI